MEGVAHNSDPNNGRILEPHDQITAYYRPSTGRWEYTGRELHAQTVARAAVMEIPIFPELEARLFRVFGPTAEAIMLHQLVYWFGKQKMQHRWCAYLTRENWRDQRGLNRKQVDRGRARLRAHESGVLEEKTGPYKRIHFRVNWVALAGLLGLEDLSILEADWEDAWEDPFEDPLPPNGLPPNGQDVDEILQAHL